MLEAGWYEDKDAQAETSSDLRREVETPWVPPSSSRVHIGGFGTNLSGYKCTAAIIISVGCNLHGFCVLSISYSYLCHMYVMERHQYLCLMWRKTILIVFLRNET
jgi:hypothetical protein